MRIAWQILLATLLAVPCGLAVGEQLSNPGGARALLVTATRWSATAQVTSDASLLCVGNDDEGSLISNGLGANVIIDALLVEASDAQEGVLDGEGTVEGEGVTEGEGLVDGEGMFDGEGIAEGDGVADGEGVTDGEGAITETQSADSNKDDQIDLTELLRVIQFYNADGFGCEDGTEDGYSLVSNDESCAPHDTDYAPQDWNIGLSELLRLIQFYNLGAYAACGEGEDGFCPAG